MLPCVQPIAQLFEEAPGTFQLARPDELVDEGPRRGAWQLRFGQRPLERERLIHLLACNASPEPEVEEPKGRQCLAPQRGVTMT